MILYYNTEGHMGRTVVKWLPLISYGGRAGHGGMKSFRFGGKSIFDIVSALAPRDIECPKFAPLF